MNRPRVVAFLQERVAAAAGHKLPSLRFETARRSLIFLYFYLFTFFAFRDCISIGRHEYLDARSQRQQTGDRKRIQGVFSLQRYAVYRAVR